MPYRNLVGQACANRAEVFKRLRDFVCRRNGSYDYSATGIGWTLHDSNYAVDENTISTNDWFVIFSPGESGSDDLYFRCTYIANYIKIEGFLYWNAATNTGVQAYNSGNNFNILDADVPVLWIYGDLDSVICISRQTSVSSVFYPVVFGRTINTLYDQSVATSAGALTAGANVVIDVGTVPAAWSIGMRLFVRDQARVDLTVAAITAKTESTVTITLANSYAAGAKLSADLGYFVSGSNQFGSTTYFLIDHAGSKNSNVSGPTNTSNIPDYGYPEILNTEHLVVPLMFQSAGAGCLGEVRNIYLRSASGGLTALNAYPDLDGINYRVFTIYSNKSVVIKEV